MLSAAPNIVLILTDQQRYDTLRSTGGPACARTENLDGLAARGLIFDCHIVANPVCSPSRAAIFTGLPPSENGLWANGCRLPENVPTLPGMLRTCGYRTAHFGKLHLEPIVRRGRRSPHPYGFETCLIAEGDQHLMHDDYFNWLRVTDPDLFVQYSVQMFNEGHDRAYTSLLPRELSHTEWVTGRACDWLANAEATSTADNGPFFLSVGYFDPHHAFNPVEPYATTFANADLPPPLHTPEEYDKKPIHYRQFRDKVAHIVHDEPRLTGIRRAYHAMIAHLDDCIGRLLETLGSAAAGRDTWVIFSSDHGEFIGEHELLWKGPFFMDDLLRVPFLAARLGADLGGRRIADVTSMLDLWPTVAGLATGNPSTTQHGRPLFDRAGRILPCGPRDAAPVEWDHPGNSAHRTIRGLRTVGHTYAEYPYDPREGELYVHAEDPHQRHNRYDDPALATVRADLARRLAALYPRGLAARPPTPHEGAW